MKTPPNNNSLPFQLDRVAFYGPTLTENLKMLDIDDISLKEYRHWTVLRVLPHLLQKQKTGMESMQLDVTHCSVKIWKPRLNEEDRY